MKLLLSILFLFALDYQSKAVNNIDNKVKSNFFWTSDNVSENLFFNFEESILDEQESNDINSLDLFILDSGQNIQSSKYTIQYLTFFEFTSFKLLLQFSFIDLPPPSLS